MGINIYKEKPVSGIKGKDLLGLSELSKDEILDILALTESVKKRGTDLNYQPLKGKTLGMIFEKNSTRTRVSFEVAIWQLGGYGLFLNKNDLQLGRGETIEDTARVLSRYVDGIVIRAYFHEDVKKLAEYADVPVINGLTDFEHPCQALADLFTIYEKKKRLNGLKLAFIGDGNNNMATSLIFGCAKVGMDITVASPKGYQPKKEIVNIALRDSILNNSKIIVTEDVKEAAEDADVIYTDVWTSMGQESEAEERKKAFYGYQVNEKLLKMAKKDVIVMHCLPAHRGEEITDEVIDGPYSVVFDQAENRLHVQKAILISIMGD
ncbi:MAG: ornithine carbamoyltransferase [Thermovenabulum sp.]|uniref:ornithine carbamoyltransferase n=1 Tax=Thermovenabulum sp. TaxID=3100335 RepID=UPI003C7C3ECD